MIETRDNYEGCPEEVAEALKAGLQVKCWVDGRVVWVCGYSTGVNYPYSFCVGGSYGYASADEVSFTDPNAQREPTVEDAIAWAKKNPFEVVNLFSLPHGEFIVSSKVNWHDEDICAIKVLTCKETKTWTPLTEVLSSWSS